MNFCLKKKNVPFIDSLITEREGVGERESEGGGREIGGGGREREGGEKYQNSSGCNIQRSKTKRYRKSDKWEREREGESEK